MIRSADWNMRGELAKIWQICFDEPPRPAHFFLNNCFRPKNSLVYSMGGKIASVIYFLPARVALENGCAQAHYIYAAATLPQYRGRGMMLSLLAAAARRGAGRGDRYSVVLPATEGLYSLYEKAGYRDFFETDIVSLPCERARALAGSEHAGRTLLTWERLSSFRSAQLARRPGSVLWAQDAFRFAAGMGRVYGDRLVLSRTGAHIAYAMCRPGPETCTVLELMARPESLAALMADLIRTVPAQTYRFRLPACSRLLGKEGELSRFGMILPLGGAAPIAVSRGADAPYLGLALD